MGTSTVVGRASGATDTLGRQIVSRRFRTVTEKQRIVQELIESGCSEAEALHAWMHASLTTVSKKSELAIDLLVDFRTS